MQEYNAYVGLDVHKDTIAVAVSYPGRERAESKGFIPNTPNGLRKMVRRVSEGLGRVLFCYEAGPCGYEVYRLISKWGHECQVVAPSMVPRKPGERVKTDRRDARKLSETLRSGALAPVWIPDREQESIRDLTRARAEMKGVEVRLKQRLSALLLRQSKKYTAGKCKWTQKYYGWLSNLKMDTPVGQLVLEEYLDAIRKAEERVRGLEEEMRRVLPSWSLSPVVESLMALRGVGLVSAMSLMAELGDISRFESPRQLMAYLGLVPSEHSSGNKQFRGGITKTGNGRARRLLVESAWCYRFPARRTHHSQKKAQKATPEAKEIAWKAQKRLCHRYRVLLRAGKEKGKVTTAIARELSGFIWDIACTVMDKSTKQAA